jgi:hypothetical protein
MNIRSCYLRLACGLAFAWSAAAATPVFAQVVAPSLYTEAIQVQGEAEGMEFDDWTGVAVADMDLDDNPGGIDIANVQIANDDEFIYIRATLHNTTPISMAKLYLGFDLDQDKATGFDLFTLGEIGTELGYQTDFAFPQATGVFNNDANADLSGGLFNGGHALIFPFHNGPTPPTGTQMEWAVYRDVVITPTGGPANPAFADPSFDFIVWTDDGISDITNVIRYTLAEAPAGTPGDFDQDQDVDGADFLEWQIGVGTEFDADDLADWRTNFGTQPPPVAAIPEPAAIALLALGLLGAAARRRS